MGVTNEFERDLNSQAGLKRPGRIDFRVLQNTADAGDGHPGLQRAFRNYLHEGGMEKDIDLIGYGIKGTSVDINNTELQQISNIGSATLSGTQWGYVGEADQPVKQADSPTFGGLTVNGNITITGTVDGVDVSDLKDNVDGFHSELKDLIQVEIQQLENINTTTISIAQWGYLGVLDQNLRQADSPTFVGLTLSANLVTTSTIDSVNISTFKSDYDTHKGSTGADHTYIDQAVTIAGTPTFASLALSGGLDMNSNAVTELPAPSGDNDASRKIYVDDLGIGVADTTVVHTNSGEKETRQDTYTKLLEIIVYKHLGNIRVAWDHKRLSGTDSAYSRLFINGVSVGPVKSATTGTYVEVSDDITNVIRPGDKIQIYGVTGDSSTYIWVTDLEIRYIEFKDNNPV